MTSPDTLRARSSLEDVITDPVLKELINASLGITDLSAPISASALESLSSLSLGCPSQIGAPRVTSLEGLEYAVNLTSFYADNFDLNFADALVPLANLNKLQSLHFSRCNLPESSLWALSSLTELTLLYLSGNPISSVEGLAPLIEHFADRVDAYRADPFLPQPNFHLICNSLTDLPSARAYILAYAKLHWSDGNFPPEVGLQQSTSLLTSGSYGVYMLTSFLTNRNFGNAYWQDDAGLFASSLPPYFVFGNAPVKIANSISDPWGNPSLLCFPYFDWKTAIETGDVNSVVNLLYSYIHYADALQNVTTSITDAASFVSLKTRPSAEFPDTEEYYFETPYFNVVPYNPRATSPQDFQDSLYLRSDDSSMATSFFYYEFKNLTEPVTGIPSPYTLNEDGSISFPVTGAPYTLNGNF